MLTAFVQGKSSGSVPSQFVYDSDVMSVSVGGPKRKSITGWLEADVDMRKEVIDNPSLERVCEERYEEDACRDYIELV